MLQNTIRLVVIDLDGTLLDSHKQLQPQTRQAIKEVKQRGILVTLATGRTWGSTAPFALQLGIDIPVITYNGAYITAIGDKHPVEKKAMSIDLAGKMLKQLEQAGFYVKVYIDEHLYVQETTEETIAFSRRFGVPFTAVGRDNLAKLTANPLKISVIERSGRIQEAWRILEGWKNRFTINRDGEYGIEITEASVNKGAALERISKMLAISMNEVMAIGNEGNDVQMICKAGLGVAMGNAYDELKKMANIVTKTNDELGVAYVLKKYILQEKDPI